MRVAVEKIRLATEAEGLDLGLRPPANEAEVDAAEAEFGHPFPEAVRAFYLVANGQRDEPGTTALLGEWPVPAVGRALAECLQQRGFWGVSKDNELASLDFETPDPEVQAASWHQRWWPIGFWQGSEMLIIDLAPTELGTSGQLIINGSHVMEGPPWVAPGLLELLEALAEGIDSRTVGLRRYGYGGGGSRWHVSPAGMPLEISGRALFDDPAPPDRRIEEFPPEWVRWVEARGPRFAGMLASAGGLIDVPPDTADLSPLALFPDLQWLDLSATTVGDVAELPDLPRLRSLVLRGVRTLIGIERFPLMSLSLLGSPDLELAGLSVVPNPIRLELDGPWSGQAPDDKVDSLDAAAGSVADAQRLLNLRPSRLRLTLRDVDVSDLDWSRTRAKQIDIVGGRIGSMDFVDQLGETVHLAFFDPTTIDLSGLPSATTVQFAFYGTAEPKHAEALSALHPPAALAAPAAWWHAFGADTDPLIWRYFTRAEFGSEDATLGWELGAARRELDKARQDEERARIMKERGLG